MFVILQIGYQKFMLESEQGLQTIMKALSKARIIENDRRFEGGKITTKGMAEIHCEVLPPIWGWCKEKGRSDHRSGDRATRAASTTGDPCTARAGDAA